MEETRINRNSNVSRETIIRSDISRGLILTRKPWSMFHVEHFPWGGNNYDFSLIISIS